MTCKHSHKSRSRRRKANRSLRRYLIVSEDSKSSLDYFRAFPIDKKRAKIVTLGGAGDALNVVQKGIELQQDAQKVGSPFIQVYCTFDRDSMPQDRYNQACQLAATQNDLTAIWSNECFELWYLLHFSYRNTAIGRKEIYRVLKGASHLGRTYQKGDPSIFAELKPKLETALKNASQLAYHAREENSVMPWNVNPSTEVHQLVNKLRELS